MKFDKVQLNHYFRFLDRERRLLIHQRVSARTIRNVDNPGEVFMYRRNEEVQALGSDIEIAWAAPIDAVPTKLKDVPIGHQFRFKDEYTAYVKISKHKIRRFSKTGFSKIDDIHCRTRNNEPVEIFGASMLAVPTKYLR